MQPQTFVFFGQVGSGKGTQVKLLTDFLKKKDGRETVYAGTGDGFRKLMESGNYTSELVKEYVNKGILVPDFLTDAMFGNMLISNLSAERNLIADGYPRTVPQSIVFEGIMKFFKREKINIIYIELSEEEATKRNLLRGRQDDTKEGLTKRFNEYKNKVVPAMDYFKDKESYAIHTINGEQSIEDVHKDIIKALEY